MATTVIAMRYAKALSLSITDEAELEPSVSALNELSGLYLTHHDFRSCIGNPAIARERRQDVLQEVLSRMGAPKQVARLVGELLDRDRIDQLDETAEAFSSIVDARLKRVAATITTAIPLRDDQIERIIRALEALAGGKVKAEVELKPDLYCGVSVAMAGAVYDGSLHTSLTNMSRELLHEELEA